MSEAVAVEILTLLLTAGIVPFVTGVITNAGMSSEMKNNIAVLISIFFGVVYAIIVGVIAVPFEVSDFLIKLLIGISAIIPVSQGFYRAFKPIVKEVERQTDEG